MEFNAYQQWLADGRQDDPADVFEARMKELLSLLDDEQIYRLAKAMSLSAKKRNRKFTQSALLMARYRLPAYLFHLLPGRVDAEEIRDLFTQMRRQWSEEAWLAELEKAERELREHGFPVEFRAKMDPETPSATSTLGENCMETAPKTVPPHVALRMPPGEDSTLSSEARSSAAASLSVSLAASPSGSASQSGTTDASSTVAGGVSSKTYPADRVSLSADGVASTGASDAPDLAAAPRSEEGGSSAAALPTTSSTASLPTVSDIDAPSGALSAASTRVATRYSAGGPDSRSDDGATGAPSTAPASAPDSGPDGEGPIVQEARRGPEEGVGIHPTMPADATALRGSQGPSRAYYQEIPPVPSWLELEAAQTIAYWYELPYKASKLENWMASIGPDEVDWFDNQRWLTKDDPNVLPLKKDRLYCAALDLTLRLMSAGLVTLKDAVHPVDVYGPKPEELPRVLALANVKPKRIGVRYTDLIKRRTITMPVELRRRISQVTKGRKGNNTLLALLALQLMAWIMVPGTLPIPYSAASFPAEKPELPPPSHKRPYRKRR